MTQEQAAKKKAMVHPHHGHVHRCSKGHCHSQGHASHCCSGARELSD